MVSPHESNADEESNHTAQKGLIPPEQTRSPHFQLNRRTLIRSATASGVTLTGLIGVSGSGAAAQSDEDFESLEERLVEIRDKFNALGQTVDDILLVDYRREGINGLRESITGLDLKKGTKQSLLSKVDAAESSNKRAAEAALNGDEEGSDEEEDATDGQLNALINKLSSLKGEKLSEDTAERLIDNARALIQARDNSLAAGDNITSPKFAEDFLNKLDGLGAEFGAILRELQDRGHTVSLIDATTDPKIRIQSPGIITIGLTLLAYALIKLLAVAKAAAVIAVKFGAIAKLQLLGVMAKLKSAAALVGALKAKLTAYQLSQIITKFVASIMIDFGIDKELDFNPFSPLTIATLVASPFISNAKELGLLVLGEALDEILEQEQESGAPMGVVELPGNVDGAHGEDGEFNCAVAGTFDGTYYTSIKDGETNPNTGKCSNTVLQIYSPPSTGHGEATLEAEKTIVDGAGNPVEVSALAWDSTREKYWAAYEADDAVYLIDRGNPEDGSEDAVASLQFRPNVTATHEEEEEDLPADGLAVDTASDTLWYSPDVDDRVFHFDTDGTLQTSLTPETDASGNKNGLISGVLVGTEKDGRPTLYLGRNGELEIIRVFADTGEFISQFETTDNRVEDLTCDSTTYDTGEAILGKDARSGVYWAFEVKSGTCQ